jgi:hypothetical protein
LQNLLQVFKRRWSNNLTGHQNGDSWWVGTYELGTDAITASFHSKRFFLGKESITGKLDPNNRKQPSDLFHN